MKFSGNIFRNFWMLVCFLSYIRCDTPGCEYMLTTLTCYGPNITDFVNNIRVDTKVINLQNADIGTLNISSFSRAQHLYELNIENSGIMDIDKYSFKNLKFLRSLSLKGNNLTSLPDAIFSNLTELEQLQLGHNFIDSVDGLFNGLKKLINLNLIDNKIPVISEDTFKDLSHLHHLNLNDNKITSIHPRAFRNMKMLMLLGLGGNPLKTVANLFPKDMFMLQYLNLTACELTMFPNDLPSSLIHLKLTKNKIQRISRADTQIYRNLNALILEDNGLKYIESGSFQDMVTLADLFLFINHLEKVPGPFPASIRSIYLDNNRINSIPSNMFHNGTKLNVLSLRINNITSLQASAFFNLESIRELNLEKNKLSVLQDDIFKFAQGMEYLNLNRLTLTAIYPDCFSNLTSLSKLEMSFVRIAKEQVHGNIFHNLPSLEELVLQESPTLAEIFITNLIIERKRIKTITKLNLEDNGLESLSSDIETYLPNIKTLSLKGNKFHCNANLIWLRTWHGIEPEKFPNFDHVFCFKPHHLHGKRVEDIKIWQFYETDPHSNHSDDLISYNESTPVSNQDHYHDFDITTPPLDYYSHINYEDSFQYDYMEGSTIKSVSEDLPIITESSTTTQMSHVTQTTTQTMQGDMKTTPQLKDNKTQAKNTTTYGIDNTIINNGHKTPRAKNGGSSSSLKTVGIAFGMAAAVIIIMLLGAFLIFIIWQRRRNSKMELSRHESEGQDYVFIADKNGKTEPKVHRKMSRAERGSTTSRASEDITNQTDMDMKVYILDVDA